MPEQKRKRRVNLVPRAALLLMVVVAVAVALFRVTSSGHGGDAENAAALWVVATTFNSNYQHNDVGPVYDRWDPSSQELISKSNYVRRHKICPTTPGRATIRSVSRSTNGFWAVVYTISGVARTDYWRFINGEWRFNLARSNPDAVRLYREPFAAYARDVGCRP